MLTSVGGGVSACRGLHSSFRPTQGGLSLNLDVSTTMILIPGPVIDFLRANQGIQDARRIDWIKSVDDESEGGFLKLKATSEWLLCDNTAPVNKKVMYEVFSNDVLMGEHSASSTELHEILKFRVLDDNDDYGILSIKFTSDSKEIIAGTSDSSICVYDLGMNRLSLRFKPHMAKKMLRNVIVKSTHSNREFKIKGLSEKPCNEL
ncbi:hypothetical protein AgCh_023137 [Apium graveolens]